ncbi:MAG: TIGR03986 family CRISPR-associated RAMP protein [Alphaproteobacteria bacterium]|jgi:CRISPR-associated protein (TIGR03986 family)|nr:TIGR03986 family CRISPR-associated RAMP protein [Alphaproteobacteria bacterium]
MAKPARKGQPQAGGPQKKPAPPPSSGPTPDIAAPYTFVPLNRHVFRPDWCDSVSMDVPFQDGFCGTLAIEIEAVTPLFIGARKTREGTAEKPNLKSRFTTDGTPDGTPAIPGTSLKGAIRSVIEIAAFGKIGTRMDDRKFSIRDLYNPQDYLQYMTDSYRPTARAGWLSVHRGTGDWHLDPCDYSLARQTHLEDYFQARFNGRINLGQKQTARDKYEKQWRGRPLDIRFSPDDWRARDDSWAKGRVLSRAENIGDGATPGTIVFTGQPQERWDKKTNRPRKGAKQVDFIFHSRGNAPVRVPDSVREDFESVHRDPNTRTPNEEWAWWRTRLYRGEDVPVFWLEDAHGGIRAMGLAMMFRLAYAHSTREFAGKGQQAHIKAEFWDLADTMFGRVGEEQKQSLKGRVRFSMATLEAPGDTADEHPVVAPLLGPKAGFYPAYVFQTEVTAEKPPRVPRRYSEQWKQGYPGYTTYMAEGGTVRGWKRYPVASQTRTPKLPEPYNGKVLTEFTPVGRGARFAGTVHVHNLRPQELGALAWALTWGFEDRLCHALGGVKPFGYGAARIRIRAGGTELERNDGGEILAGEAAITELRRCADAFQDEMNGFLQGRGVNTGWRESEQIRELLAAADRDIGDKAAAAGRLAYLPAPTLYQDSKKHRAILPLLIGGADPASSVVSESQSAAPGPAPRGGPGRPAAAKTPAEKPKPRRGTVDGDPVEILGESGAKLQVRFLETGDIEWLNPDELD